jgi:hypothetical protein
VQWLVTPNPRFARWCYGLGLVIAGLIVLGLVL